MAGWNGSAGASAPKTPPKKAVKVSAIHGIIALVAVLAIGAIAYLFVGENASRTKVEGPQVDSKRGIADVKPDIVKSESKESSEDVKPKTRPVKRKPRPPFADKPFAEMDSREKAIMMQYWASDTNNIIVGVDMRTRTPPPLFENVTQNSILPYMEPGADVVPMGPISDAEARKAIDLGVKFNFDDPDDVLEKKQFVKEMLQDLKEYMDKGGHAVDYFAKLDDRQDLEHTTMMTCREEVNKLRMEGRLEEARETMEAFNKYLEGKGLPKMRMNLNKAADLRREQERLMQESQGNSVN